MTRNYNNSRQGGARSSSRNYSGSRPGGRRSQHTSRPGGPRPHRNSIDQAWESGATPKHADYRRRTPQGPSSQGHSRNYGPSDHSPAHPGSRPFGNRQNNSQRFDRSPRSNSSNYSQRSRSSDTERRTFDNQRDGGQRGYAGGPNHTGFRDNRNNEQHPPYRDRERTSTQDPSERRPKRFDRQSREFQRSDGFSRSSKDNRYAPHSDTRNPRRSGHPSAQGNNSFRRRPDFDTRPYEEAQFEGDYEHFDDSGEQLEERHVTRLPDGRVLKGPRPAQRRDARFWTDIADETENLIQPAKTTQADTNKKTQRVPSPKTGTPKTPRKPHTHKASTVVREKKSKGKQATPRSRSTGPKPSQRGFKWPNSRQS